MTVTARAATPADWLNPAAGNWTSAANWSIGPTVYPNNGSPNAADTYDVNVAAVGASYTVTLDASTAPTATIAVHNLVLNSSAATIQATGGTLTATGEFRVDAGTFKLAGASLRNTAVTGAGGTFNPATGVLDNVVLQRDAAVSNNSPDLDPNGGILIQNGLVLNGSTFTISHFNNIALNGGIRFTGTQTLGGTGTLLLAGDRAPFLKNQTGTLTIGSGVTVRGGGEFIYSSTINQGTIRADNPSIVLVMEGPTSPAAALTNRGILEATAGALHIEGAFDNSQGVIRANGGNVVIGYNLTYTTANLGTLRTTSAGGSLQISGTLNNAGATLTANADTGNIDINGTVSGGTLSTADGSLFTMTGSSPQLTSLTLAGGLKISNGATPAIKALTLNNATITLSPGSIPNTSVALTSAASESILGTGEIVLAGTGNSEIGTYGGTLTLGPTIVTRVGSNGAFIHSVLNKGTLLSQVAGKTVQLSIVSNQGQIYVSAGGKIDAESLTNSGTTIAETTAQLILRGTWNNAGGTIQATTGATMTLWNAPTSFGTMSANAATVNIDGAFTAAQLRNISLTATRLGITANGVVTATGDTMTVTDGNILGMDGGVLRGGTLAASGTGLVNGRNGTLDGVTITAPVLIDGQLAFNSTITLNSTLTLKGTGGAGSLFITGPVVGTGLIILDAPAQTVQTLTSSIGAGLTIRTGAGGGTVGYVTGVFTNNGLISSQTTGQTIAVKGTTLTNTGTLQAINGGLMTAGPVVNSGTLSVAAGSTLTLTGPITNTGTISVADGQLILAGSMTTVGLGPITRTGFNSSITLNGALDNTSSTLALTTLGPLQLGPAASITNGTITGNATNGLSATGDATHKVVLKNLTLNAPLAMTGGALTLTSVIGTPLGISLTNVNLVVDGNAFASVMGQITRTGGSATIGGTADLTKTSFDLDAGLGNVTLSNGGITNGTIIASAGSKLTIPSGKTGTFGVGTIDVEINLQGGIAVLNGTGLVPLVLAQHGKITGNGTVQLAPPLTQSFSGPGGIVLGADPANLIRNTTTRIVTLGTDFYINGQYLNIQGGTGGIVNKGTIAVDPGGTLILTNVTNQGTIIQANGSVQANGAYSPAGPVAMAAGAILGGTGTINAQVINGGTIAPGNSIGTLTVNGDVTFSAASHLLIEVGAPGISDVLNVVGSVDLTGPQDFLDISALTTITPGATYTIITATGEIAGQFDAVTPGFTVSYENPHALVLTAVPEPGGLITGAAVLALVMAGRRNNACAQRGRGS